MKILHFISHIRLGAGLHVVETAIEQVRRHHNVGVGVSQDVDINWRTDPAMRAQLRAAGIPVWTVGDFFQRDLNTLQRTAGRLAADFHDSSASPIVHAHSAMPAAVARWAGAPCVVCTCHGWDPKRSRDFNLQDALALRLCDAVVSPSVHWARRLNEECLVNAAVVPYGIDLSRYPSLATRRKEGRGERDPVRLVAVAELTDRKGLDLLLTAMPAVWRYFPETELHLFGSGDAEGELLGLAGQVDEGRKRVIFHGRVSDPYHKLVDFDVFCLPSRSDNLPLAIMEAMLAGLPIVATAVGGIPELVEEGSCGFLVGPESAADLAETLLTLLRTPRGELRKLGLSGEAHARGSFPIERCADRLEEIYRFAMTQGTSKLPIGP